MAHHFHLTILALFLACPEGGRYVQQHRDSDTGSSDTGSSVAESVDGTDLTNYFVNGRYLRLRKGCVSGHNIASAMRNVTFRTCWEACDRRPDCEAIEFGRPNRSYRYGASRRDCRLQNGTDAVGCDGQHYNMGLYIKTRDICLSSYVHYPRACVSGHNIELSPNLFSNHSYDLATSRSECQVRCDAHPSCMSFEFGVDYGGAGSGRAGDCKLQSSDNHRDCDGSHYNFDLYKKRDCLHMVHYDVEGSWFWLETVHTDGRNITVMVGSTSTTETTVSNEMELSMSMSVEAGFASAGHSISVRMGQEVSRSNSFATQHSDGLSFSPSFSGADGLWQWQFQYTDPRGDREVGITRLRHYAMTVDPETPPRCLPGFFRANVAPDEGPPCPERVTPEECQSSQFHGAQECISTAAEID